MAFDLASLPRDPDRLIEIILGLRPASVLVVVTHPCFREESYSSLKTQFKNEDYLQNGASFGGR